MKQVNDRKKGARYKMKYGIALSNDQWKKTDYWESNPQPLDHESWAQRLSLTIFEVESNFRPAKILNTSDVTKAIIRSAVYFALTVQRICEIFSPNRNVEMDQAWA